jgi:hypothetical protein
MFLAAAELAALPDSTPVAENAVTVYEYEEPEAGSAYVPLPFSESLARYNAFTEVLFPFVVSVKVSAAGSFVVSLLTIIGKPASGEFLTDPSAKSPTLR